jgi:hypothetical protein
MNDGFEKHISMGHRRADALLLLCFFSKDGKDWMVRLLAGLAPGMEVLPDGRVIFPRSVGTEACFLDGRNSLTGFVLPRVGVFIELFFSRIIVTPLVVL